MELIFVKGISLCIVMVISLVLGLMPLQIASAAQRTLNAERRRRCKRCISFLGCFGGGVFLAASLLDLLPDVRESFETVKRELNFQTDFPVVEFVVSVGFFIVFIIEQVLLAYKENSAHVCKASEHERLIHDDGHGPGPGPGPRPISYNSIDDGSFAAPAPSPSAFTSPVSVNDDDKSHDHSTLMVSLHQDPSSHSTLRTMILLTALSVHSIFEGLAIGLQLIAGHLTQLLMAVSIHKGIIALSLGVNLTQSRLKYRLKILLVVAFSCASPLGIGIGMGINSYSHSTTLMNAILQGFACGTFLYVTFFEVIPHELNQKQDRLLKLLFILLGFTTVCGIIFLTLSPQQP